MLEQPDLLTPFFPSLEQRHQVSSYSLTRVRPQLRSPVPPLFLPNIPINPHDPYRPRIESLPMSFLPPRLRSPLGSKYNTRRISLRSLIPRLTRYWDQDESGDTRHVG
jgi:hypothetical protein